MNTGNHPSDFKDLQGGAAIEKMKEIGKGICFFCTFPEMGKPFTTRPMAIQQVDDSGHFFFLSATDSDKNREIENGSSVQLLLHSGQSYLSLYGRAEISTDLAEIQEHWTPLAKAWFTEGETDPRLSVIRFVPQEGYYWDTKNGAIVSYLKMAIGAVTGSQMDDGIQGKIAV